MKISFPESRINLAAAKGSAASIWSIRWCSVRFFIDIRPFVIFQKLTFYKKIKKSFQKFSFVGKRSLSIKKSTRILMNWMNFTVFQTIMIVQKVKKAMKDFFNLRTISRERCGSFWMQMNYCFKSIKKFNPWKIWVFW